MGDGGSPDQSTAHRIPISRMDTLVRTGYGTPLHLWLDGSWPGRNGERVILLRLGYKWFTRV